MFNLFDNPGAKIRVFAMILFVGLLVMAALGAVGTFFYCWFEMGFLGIIVGMFLMTVEFVLAAFSAYITCLFMVAFGDLVHYTYLNWKTNTGIQSKIATDTVVAPADTPKNQNSATASKPAVAEPSKPVSSAAPKANAEPPRIADNEVTTSYWICGNCNTKNLISRDDCWACGHKKNIQ